MSKVKGRKVFAVMGRKCRLRLLPLKASPFMMS
jgi:hypothetical protein